MSAPTRRQLLRFAILTLAAGCALLSLSRADGAPCFHCRDAPPEWAQTVPETSAEQLLAERYTPIVYVRNQKEPCDTRGSPYVPVPVEFLFDNNAIVLRKHEGGRTTDEVRAPNGADLFGKDDTYFLDFPGDPKRPGCRFERDFLARVNEYTPTAYAHIAYEDGQEGFALQYWLFYYFNHWNNTHEGDWEMIQLTFEGPTPADALTQEPTGVGYSQHAGGERADWDDSKLTREGERPVVFAAAGANANQFEPNVILGRGDNGTGFGCDDARRPSRRVDPEVVLMEEPGSASDDFAWLAFDGRWGERAPWEFNGPTGPNDKRAWNEPFSWQAGLRPSSITVPYGTTFGPNAVNAFCDAVWILSTPFALLLNVPNGVILIAAGTTVVALGLVVTRGTYRPVTPAPLRQRRRFGQVLTSSGRIYRRHALLFLGIGLLFVPLGFVIAVFQWLLFEPTPIDTITGFFGRQRLVEGLIALAIGNLASSLAYFFVLLAALVAVAKLESSTRNEALADYADVARQLPGLLIPRLRAIGIVLLLAITVIGLPWAVRNAVGWFFIEEAIILDGTASGKAADASAEIVKGRWLYTFLAVTALGIVGYATGPAIAITLLLTASLSVSAINMISSLVFTALTPFVAISYALLYYDLASAYSGAQHTPAD